MENQRLNSQKKISILGCGWLGIPLAKKLVADAYAVAGSTTTNEKLTLLSESGIEAFQISIDDSAQDWSAFLASDILIIALTSKNIAAFEELIGKIEASRILKVLFISSTSVYPNTNEIVDESNETISSPLAAIEQLFINNKNFRTSILRFAGLFGYDRKPGNFVKEGKIMDDPEGFVNMIHRDDCIAIIQQIIQQDVWDEVFNACADTHPTRREFYTKEAEKLGKSAPLFNESAANSFKIISNDKLKKRLGFEFKYGDLMNVD